MSTKKLITSKETAVKNNVRFCTECGEDLTMFGIEKVDRKKVEERHKNCKEKGKFNGDVCSMMFISEEEPPPVSVEAD